MILLENFISLCFALFKSFFSLLFSVVLFQSCLVTGKLFLLVVAAYPNTERPSTGNDFELEILDVSIWDCVQAPPHCRRYITCGTPSAKFKYSASFFEIENYCVSICGSFFFLMFTNSFLV